MNDFGFQSTKDLVVLGVEGPYKDRWISSAGSGFKPVSNHHTPCTMSRPEETYDVYDEDVSGTYMPLMGHGTRFILGITLKTPIIAQLCLMMQL